MPVPRRGEWETRPGLDVADVTFAEGITAYGADLSGAVIIGSTIAAGNMGETDFEDAWLGDCTLTGWNLIGANLRHLRAPGTTFERCWFAHADATGADFSTSSFHDCEFDGQNLGEWDRDAVIRWDTDQPPVWPPGFTLP